MLDDEAKASCGAFYTHYSRENTSKTRSLTCETWLWQNIPIEKPWPVIDRRYWYHCIPTRGIAIKPGYTPQVYCNFGIQDDLPGSDKGVFKVFHGGHQDYQRHVGVLYDGKRLPHEHVGIPLQDEGSYVRRPRITHPPWLFQLQMRISYPFLYATDLHMSLLIIRTHSFYSTARKGYIHKVSVHLEQFFLHDCSTDSISCNE